MNCVSDTPCHNMLRDDLWVEDEESRKTQVTLEIVQSFVDLEPRLSHKKKSTKSSKSPEDKVYLNSCEFLTLRLMYIEFSDSLREADGNRILRCWRYLMLIFRSTQRRNYAIEGLNLLSQYHFFFSPRQREQLLWSRCINSNGIPGRNIPGDLHMEHLNGLCKMAVANLGANKMLGNVLVFCIN